MLLKFGGETSKYWLIKLNKSDQNTVVFGHFY